MVRHLPPNKTEYKVCPFCGKPDWCSVDEYDDGARYIFCRRFAETGLNPSKYDEVRSSVNGQSFIFLGISDGGAYRFESKEQNQKRYAQKKSQGETYWALKKDSSDKKVSQRTAEEVEEVSNFYKLFLKKLVLEDYHKAKLYKEWGEKVALWADAYNIKSLPPVDSCRYKNKLNLKNRKRQDIMKEIALNYPKCGAAGFYMDPKYGLQCYEKSGIIYPIYNETGQILCLRIGQDYPTVSNEEGTYTCSPFTYEWSFQKEGEKDWNVVYSRIQKIAEIQVDKKYLPDIENRKISNKYVYMYNSHKEGGNAYGGQVGLYLPKQYIEEPTKAKYDYVFATEGEKKCIVGANTLGYPFVCIPGVNSFRKVFDYEDGKQHSLMDYLQTMHCKYLVVAYDADKSTNISVLAQEKEFVKALIEHGIRPAIADWNGNVGKGIDDLLMTGMRPVISAVSVEE